MCQSLTTDSVRAVTLLRWTALITLFIAVLMPPGMSTATGQVFAEGLPPDFGRGVNHRPARSSKGASSQKWFISVIGMNSCGACERLKYDFAHADHLTAFVDVDDHTRSWSHFNVYEWNDPAHQWRWQNVQVTMFPTVLIQPPISGEYGDPRTLVWKKAGYNGDDRQLAREIRHAITAYVTDLPDDSRVRSSLAALPLMPQQGNPFLRSSEHGREMNW